MATVILVRHGRTTANATGLLAGRTLRGGLIFAGVNGANEYQGDPPAVKIAPRAGATYALNTNTVRCGL